MRNLKNSSNYRNNSDNIKCNLSGLGDRWAPAIPDTEAEVIFLGSYLSPECLEYWIGGSTNVSLSDARNLQIPYDDYITDDSGMILLVLQLAN